MGLPPYSQDPSGYPGTVLALLGLSLSLKAFAHLPVFPCPTIALLSFPPCVYLNPPSSESLLPLRMSQLLSFFNNAQTLPCVNSVVTYPQFLARLHSWGAAVGGVALALGIQPPTLMIFWPLTEPINTHSMP